MRVLLGMIGLAVVGFCQTIEPLTQPGQFLGSPAMSPDGKSLLYARSDPEPQLVIRGAVFAGEDDKGGFPGEARWSPDGQRIAFLRSYCHHCSHQLFLKNASGGEEFPLGETCGGSSSWTPDGRNLITTEPFGDDEECQLVLIPADGSRRTVLMVKEGDIASISPDGKRLLYSAGNVLKLVGLNSDYRLAGIPVAIASEPHAITSINWVPDGSAVVYQCWRYTRLLPMGGPIYAPKLLDTVGNVTISQMLADGSALGSESIYPGALWRLDLKQDVETKIRDVPWTDSEFAASPNGEMVAIVTGRNGPSQVWVSKMDGSSPRVLLSAIPPYNQYGDNTMAGDLSWSPDGRWITFLTSPGVGHGDTEARLFVIPAAGGALQTLVELCSLVGGGLPWAADGKSVFIARDKFESDDFKTDYFRVDILTGKETAVSENSLPPRPMGLAPQGAEGARLSADGRFLYYEKHGELKSWIVLVHGLVR